MWKDGRELIRHLRRLRGRRIFHWWLARYRTRPERNHNGPWRLFVARIAKRGCEVKINKQKCCPTPAPTRLFQCSYYCFSVQLGNVVNLEGISGPWIWRCRCPIQPRCARGGNRSTPPGDRGRTERTPTSSNGTKFNCNKNRLKST